MEIDASLVTHSTVDNRLPKQIASCKLYFTDLLTPEKISRGAEGNEGRERIVDHMDGMIDQSLRSFSDIC